MLRSPLIFFKDASHQAKKPETEFFAAPPLAQNIVAPSWKEINLEALKSDQSPTYSQITRMSSTDLRNTWSVFPRQYAEEYEQCIETILSANKRIYILSWFLFLCILRVGGVEWFVQRPYVFWFV
ncbi:hypothetical protein SOVF_031190 [Spinacia oleracea]|nr:hypothetical protein SOVF_031190 [Spinacia oleracea]